MRPLLWLAVLGAVVVRVALMRSAWAASFDRVETHTPAASLHALREGVFLQYELGVSPYGHGTLHAPPLLLWLLHWLPDALLPALGVVADVATAALLAKLSTAVALVYVLNPLTVASCVAGSPANWYAPFVAGAIVARAPAAAALSLAVAVTLQPAAALLLLPTLAAVRGVRALALCVSAVAAAAALSQLCARNTAWLADVWLFPFSSLDVTPTLGLHWYFFMELFAAFEALYRLSWLVLVAVPLPAVAVALRAAPPAAWAAALLVAATLGPRPTPVDAALAHALLPLLPAVSLLPLPVYYLCAALLPVLWRAWVVTGAGNANFYYAATVGAAAAHMALLLDVVNSTRVALYRARHGLPKQ